MAGSVSKIPVILLAFANDDNRSLRQLDEEQRTIKRLLEGKEKKFEVKTLPAARAEDVVHAFQQYRGRICIFHYGGHTDKDEIFLRKPYRGEKGVKADNLAEFLALQENLVLVFLNSCLSLRQARLYHSQGVKSVIATDQKIGDKAACQFAELFYRGMATGADIGRAYREAEKGFNLQAEAVWRGNISLEDLTTFPWRLFPSDPPEWRLPLTAKRLTRIPSIDLNREFLGREKDMERLRAKLEETSRVVVVNGLGGVGKTILANAYMQQYGGAYDHLAWINRGEDLIKAVALNEDLADTLGLPFNSEEKLDDRFRHILRKLRHLPGRNLLVVDNAWEQVAQKQVYDLLPGSPNWKVLLTSRLRFSGFDRFQLNNLAPAPARKLFLTHYQGACTEEELEALLKEIGYHTLTVELLARLLDKLNKLLSVSELTEMLRQKKLDNPDLQEKVWARHSGEERGIYLHLLKAFELTRLSDREQWLLKQFIVLPVERYSAATLADFLQKRPLALNKTLNSLAAKGWLSLHDDKTFSIHPLIRQVAEYQLQPGFDDLEILVETLIQKMSIDDYANPMTTRVPWINYAIAVEHFLSGEKKEQIAELQNNVAFAYHDLGQYGRALDYQQKCLAIWESALESNHPALANSYNNIAVPYDSLGQYKQALVYLKKALVIQESALESNHPDLAVSYHNIALTYRSLKQYEQALVYHEKCLAILESALESNHPDLALSYNNIAATYHSLKQYEQALVYDKKALTILESALESNHPNLASSYNAIGATYRSLKQYEQALDYNKKGLAIRESVLESNHPDLAVSYNQIAETYRSLKQYEQALVYHKKALAIRESVLEPNHPDLATSYHNIAETYHRLGLYEQALVYLKKALIIEGSALKPNHPDLATCYHNIAFAYRSLGQYEQALDYDKKALAIGESALESNHPDLAVSYNNIAASYRSLGQYEQALVYHKKALAIGESVLELNHPNLAYFYGNIAVTYRSLGRYEQAEAYQAKADAIRKKSK